MHKITFSPTRLLFSTNVFSESVLCYSSVSITYFVNKHRHWQEWTVDWREIVVSLRLACAARKRDNWFPAYLYIELITCIDDKT